MDVNDKCSPLPARNSDQVQLACGGMGDRLAAWQGAVGLHIPAWAGEEGSMASGCVPTRRRRRATGDKSGKRWERPRFWAPEPLRGRSHLLPCPPDQPTRPREISFMYQDDTMALMAKELKIERETLPLRLPKELAAKIGLYARFTAFSRDYVVTRILEYVGRIVEPRERSSPCVPRRGGNRHWERCGRFGASHPARRTASPAPAPGSSCCGTIKTAAS